MKCNEMAKLVGCVALATWVALAPVAWACSVPVFRYALERWPSDAYRVAVFQRGKLSEADQKVVDWLNQVGTPEESYPRLVVRAFDVDGELDEGVKKIWETCKDAPLPHMVVFYPAMARIPEPTWSGKLSAEAAQRLVGSPARKQIAERILNGESAVWVLLEIGDKAKDDAAAKTLATQFEKVKEELQIPEQDPPVPWPPPGADDAGQAAPGVDVEVVGEQPDVALGPELRVGFSLLRVQRTDAAESLFIQMLLHTEEDLTKLKHPMAFPVYGRGRALFALVGEGINEENIFEACAFLVGPCACQIKAQAPGTDLLMLTDWDRLLEGEMVKDELPPLLGVPDAEQVAAAKAPASKDAKPSPAAPEAAPSNAPLYRNIAIAVAAALGLLVLATVVVLRKSKEQ
ncbi:hypothetical protein HQ576_02345 [bacterium]|nr:hypothetical protein [bacterium]